MTWQMPCQLIIPRVIFFFFKNLKNNLFAKKPFKINSSSSIPNSSQTQKTTFLLLQNFREPRFTGTLLQLPSPPLPSSSSSSSSSTTFDPPPELSTPSLSLR